MKAAETRRHNQLCRITIVPRRQPSRSAQNREWMMFSGGTYSIVTVSRQGSDSMDLDERKFIV